MFSFPAIALLGFFLGMRHAMDPDHVIAVTTIVSRQRSVLRAALIGVLWGLGHTFTISVVGAGMILFRLAIPPRLGLLMELSVGLMLILLGTLSLTGVLNISGSLPLTDSQPSDTEVLTQQCWLRRALREMGIYQVLRPLVVGVVHGLAGSAALALLLMTTIRDPWRAIVYLIIFGAGTIAGMMLITAAVALPFGYTAERFAWVNRGLVTASGVLSFCFGFFLVYQTGFVAGLFTSHPQWTPR